MYDLRYDRMFWEVYPELGKVKSFLVFFFLFFLFCKEMVEEPDSQPGRRTDPVCAVSHAWPILCLCARAADSI